MRSSRSLRNILVHLIPLFLSTESAESSESGESAESHEILSPLNTSHFPKNACIFILSRVSQLSHEKKGSAYDLPIAIGILALHG